jgi:hypothetical protein
MAQEEFYYPSLEDRELATVVSNLHHPESVGRKKGCYGATRWKNFDAPPAWVDQVIDGLLNFRTVLPIILAAVLGKYESTIFTCCQIKITSFGHDFLQHLAVG